MLYSRDIRFIRFIIIGIFIVLTTIIFPSEILARNCIPPPERDSELELFIEKLRQASLQIQGVGYDPNSHHSVSYAELVKSTSQKLNILKRFGLAQNTLVYGFFSDSARTTNDEIIPIPKAKFWCIVRPGDTVFLSDVLNNHYTTIYEIDRKKDTVDISDPWPEEIFLKKDKNEADVAATIVPAPGPGNKKLVRITKDEFQRVIMGLSTIDSPQLIEHFFSISPISESNVETQFAFGLSLLNAPDSDFNNLLDLAVKRLRIALDIAEDKQITDITPRIAKHLYLALYRLLFKAQKDLSTESTKKIDDAIRKMWARYGKTELLNSLNTDQNIHLGEMALNVKDLNSAGLFFSRAIEIQPESEEAYIGRADVFNRTAEFSLSLSDSTKALDLLDKRLELLESTETSRRSSDILAQLDNYSERSHIKTLYARALFLRGNARLPLGDKIGGEEDARLLIKLRPDWSKGYIMAAASLCMSNEKAEAVKYYGYAIDREKDPELRAALVNIQESILKSIKHKE